MNLILASVLLCRNVLFLSTGAKVHTLKKAPGGHFTNAEIEQVLQKKTAKSICSLSIIPTPDKQLDTLV